MSRYYLVTPTDSLFMRGNLAFGDSGEHGATRMPPLPSVFAGAFRSAILAGNSEELAHFATHKKAKSAAFQQCLGTPEQPGTFRLTWLSLGMMTAKGVTPLLPLPADLLAASSDSDAETALLPLQPKPVNALVQSGGELPLRAVLRAAKATKPVGGRLLSVEGYQRHLRGKLPEAADIARASALFSADPRLGIGLDAATGTVSKGLIYTTEGQAFKAGAGFVVGIEGADALLPDSGLLRLGGDGRSASWQRISFTPPTADLAVIVQSRRFRLILNTPALFTQGWLPDGVTRHGDDWLLQGDGFSARLVCAAIGRKEVVSGWDLANWQPKPAEAMVPAGSVYWFSDFTGEAQKLMSWVAAGTADHNTSNTPRRAEGFNNACIGQWLD